MGTGGPSPLRGLCKVTLAQDILWAIRVTCAMAPLSDKPGKVPLCALGLLWSRKGSLWGREESPSRWWALTTPAPCSWCS